MTAATLKEETRRFYGRAKIYLKECQHSERVRQANAEKQARMSSRSQGNMLIRQGRYGNKGHTEAGMAKLSGKT